jgi:sortase A
MVSGTLLLVDVGVTLVWQEPLSALFALFNQNALAAELAGPADLTRLELAELARLRAERRRIAFLARVMSRSIRPGDPIGHIRIRRMGIDFIVVQGTDESSLRRGPGHYPGTPLPGLPGTVAIAGHRTTYLAPFHKLRLMRQGDPIVLETPYARFLYRTEKQRIVLPTAYRYVTHRVSYDRLALTACHPLYSASRRIVVFGRLVSMEARGRARVRLRL